MEVVLPNEFTMPPFYWRVLEKPQKESSRYHNHVNNSEATFSVSKVIFLKQR